MIAYFAGIFHYNVTKSNTFFYFGHKPFLLLVDRSNTSSIHLR
uniref:Uncharacterized protein n=1 Tax=Rhizophora mucronata TaxID=61149 RepID=A0A2P2N6M5_RHIMU